MKPIDHKRNWAYQQVLTQLRQASVELKHPPAGPFEQHHTKTTDKVTNANPAVATEHAPETAAKGHSVQTPTKRHERIPAEHNTAVATAHLADTAAKSRSKQTTEKKEALIPESVKQPPAGEVVATEHGTHNVPPVRTMLSQDIITMCCAMLMFRGKNAPFDVFERLVRLELQKTAITPELLKILGTLADRIFFDKDGNTRNQDEVFSEWKLAHKYRQELLAAKKLPQNTELDEDARKQCEQKWALHFFQHRLTEKQQKERKYKLRRPDDFGDIHLTGDQRSFISSMLRKYSSIILPIYVKVQP